MDEVVVFVEFADHRCCVIYSITFKFYLYLEIVKVLCAFCTYVRYTPSFGLYTKICWVFGSLDGSHICNWVSAG